MTDTLLLNVRYALRALRRSPGFTATAALTLSLGIGANSAVFSALDAVLLQPLPYPHPERIVRLRQTSTASGETNVAAVRLKDWGRLTSSFEAITGYVVEDVSDTTRDPPERVRRATVLPGFLTTWGIRPALGRDFTDGEHRLGGPPAVLISERYWQRRFGADRGVLGKSVGFDNRTYQVVGVMPATFDFPDRDVDWWVPEWVDAPWAQAREFTSSTGFGRLRAGVTVDRARADLDAVQAQLSLAFPRTDRDLRPAIMPFKEDLVGGSRRSLWLLFGAVSVLLVIACSNIAALLLSRGAQRAPAIAVRYALGASRRAVSLQLLTEAFVLAAVGGVAGLFVAVGMTAGLQRLAADLPRLYSAGIDARIALYTLASVVMVTLLCGVIPAWRASGRGGDLRSASGARVSSRHSLQWLLAGVQVALSVALLSGAGLLLRSAVELMRVDAGFDPAHTLTFRVSGSFGEERQYDRTVQRINRTIDELRMLPGVSAAATAGLLPGLPGAEQGAFHLVEGSPDERLVAGVRVVSPSYFATMHIPIVAGELCSRPSGATGTTEVMVNRRFADRYLSGRSQVGLHLAGGTPDRIMGVVENAREHGIDLDPGPIVYQCFSASTPFPWFLVRTPGNPEAVAGAVRQKIRELEPRRSVYDIMPLGDRIGTAYAEHRMRTILLTTFAVSALLLACLGVYGTLSHVVGLRRREVGLRLALGAGRAGILRRFMWEGLRVAAAAAAIGLGLSLAFTRALSGMLFGVRPSDPATLSAVLGLVLVVATAATLIPAARAALLQPMRILREE